MSTSIRPLVAGNWKMHGSRASTRALVGGFLDRLGRGGPPGCEIAVCPPAPYLAEVAAMLSDVPSVALGAQDCHPARAGAHTGDVSADMLRDVGCAYAIVGHSERRADHGEDGALVRAKAEAVIGGGLRAIVCVGETLADREAGRADEVVDRQMRESLPQGAAAGNTVIAYEPVWAIGTGRTPGLADVAAMHGRIRAGLEGLPGSAKQIRILYGGSVKPENAREILAAAEVDGVLVGGASLDADDFWAICRSCP